MAYDIDLSGHRALVTGGGQGVGAEIAATLGRAGAEVLVNDLVEERAAAVADSIVAAGGQAKPAAFDVTDYDAVVAAFRAHPPVDILVNNAGNAGRALTMSAEDLVTFLETEPAEWDRFLRVNLYGVMYATRASLPKMVEANWGRIITIISDAGRVGEPKQAAYAAAKAGAAGFSRALAREVGRNNITVNCVSLGTMNTQGFTPEQEEGLAPMLKRYVVRRRGLPRDVAAMVTFLASPQAEWITGQTYPVNGGYSFAL
jgi:NAD(P)-dependent dehydrogenase (short-subunit alcohol dehydrogenase family)